MMTLKGTVPAYSLARPQSQPRRIRTEAEREASSLLVAYLGVWVMLILCAVLAIAALGATVGIMVGWLIP